MADADGFEEPPGEADADADGVLTPAVALVSSSPDGSLAMSTTMRITHSVRPTAPAMMGTGRLPGLPSGRGFVVVRVNAEAKREDAPLSRAGSCGLLSGATSTPEVASRGRENGAGQWCVSGSVCPRSIYF
ncbi:hypothetical protein ABZ614_20675 [Streptomyces sp. NPDC013178]|uniref:hypothetical protein n=1 Tax=Streptomyces sp. NPDC013178 TaxID=3155118 RepID=UPI0033F333EF